MITFDGVLVGLQQRRDGRARHNRPVSFGKPSVTIEPGKDVWATRSRCRSSGCKALAGRKLRLLPRCRRNRPDDMARQALQTSYVGGRHRREGITGRVRVPFSTASWFFLDARHDGAGRHQGDRRLRRLDHRWHRLR
jgi:hypothetical protein